jgi:hypothetical protein
MEPLDPDYPYFRGADLRLVAGLSRDLANVWLHRGFLRPTKVDRRGRRNKPMFSMAVIFEAKLIRVLSERLDIGPSSSNTPAELIRKDTTCLTSMLANEKSWMWAAARSVERGKSLNLVASITRSDGRWRYVIHGEDETPDHLFGDLAPQARVIARLPITALFEDVYKSCRSIRAAQSDDGGDHGIKRRARS